MLPTVLGSSWPDRGVPVPEVEDDQSVGSKDPTPCGDPAPEPLRRSGRAPVQRPALKPTFQGQTHEANHLVTQVDPTITLEHESNETPVLAKTFQKAFAQTHNLKQGTKKFGEKSKQAAVTEMKQLHGRSCFKPVDVNKLTDKQRRQAVNSLFFVTEKRDGRIKGRTVADGSKQRPWTNEEEVAGPAVKVESATFVGEICWCDCCSKSVCQ